MECLVIANLLLLLVDAGIDFLFKSNKLPHADVTVFDGLVRKSPLPDAVAETIILPCGGSGAPAVRRTTERIFGSL